MDEQEKLNQASSEANTDVANSVTEGQDVESSEANLTESKGFDFEETLNALVDKVEKEFGEEGQEIDPETQSKETEPVAVNQELSPEQTTPEVYEPDYTYKAMGEEYEFDDKLKSIITSKEDEENWRSIMSKAKGLEHYEAKHKRLEDSHAQLQAEHENKMGDAYELAQVVSNFNQKVGSNDLGLQFKALQDAGLSEDKILNIAQHVLNIRKLDPQQRTAYENQYVQQDQLNKFESAYQSQQTQIAELKKQQAESTLNSFLSDKQDFIQEFEGRDELAKGTFATRFIQFGLDLEKAEGKPLELGHAFDKFKKLYQLNGSKQPELTNVVEKKPPPPSIPNIQGSGHSPINRQINSLDDFEKYAESITIRE